MTFQFITTYEQSMKLKELGMPNHSKNASLFEKALSPSYLRRLDPSGESPALDAIVLASTEAGMNSDMRFVARAFTRQELEDFLMERYKNIATHVWEGEDPSNRHTTIYLDTVGATEGELQDWEIGFDSNAGDPFFAYFNAVVWTLEEEKAAA